MKNLFFCSLCFFFLLVSCSKDNDISNAELIVNDWRITARTVDPPIAFGGTMVSDLYAQAESCYKDDIISFKSDGKYTVEEGLTKCDDSDPQVSEVGTWQLNSDETILVLTDSDSDVTEINIVKMSKNSIEMNFIEKENDVNYTYTLILDIN